MPARLVLKFINSLHAEHDPAAVGVFVVDPNFPRISSFVKRISSEPFDEVSQHL